MTDNIKKLKAENKRLREFVESLTQFGGPYPEIIGTHLLTMAYRALQPIEGSE